MDFVETLARFVMMFNGLNWLAVKLHPGADQNLKKAQEDLAAAEKLLETYQARRNQLKGDGGPAAKFCLDAVEYQIRAATREEKNAVDWVNLCAKRLSVFSRVISLCRLLQYFYEVPEPDFSTCLTRYDNFEKTLEYLQKLAKEIEPDITAALASANKSLEKAKLEQLSDAKEFEKQEEVNVLEQQKRAIDGILELSV